MKIIIFLVGMSQILVGMEECSFNEYNPNIFFKKNEQNEAQFFLSTADNGKKNEPHRSHGGFVDVTNENSRIEVSDSNPQNSQYSKNKDMKCQGKFGEQILGDDNKQKNFLMYLVSQKNISQIPNKSEPVGFNYPFLINDNIEGPNIGLIEEIGSTEVQKKNVHVPTKQNHSLLKITKDLSRIQSKESPFKVKALRVIKANNKVMYDVKDLEESQNKGFYSYELSQYLNKHNLSMKDLLSAKISPLNIEAMENMYIIKYFQCPDEDNDIRLQLIIENVNSIYLPSKNKKLLSIKNKVSGCFLTQLLSEKKPEVCNEENELPDDYLFNYFLDGKILPVSDINYEENLKEQVNWLKQLNRQLRRHKMIIETCEDTEAKLSKKAQKKSKGKIIKNKIIKNDFFIYFSPFDMQIPLSDIDYEENYKKRSYALSNYYNQISKHMALLKVEHCARHKLLYPINKKTDTALNDVLAEIMKKIDFEINFNDALLSDKEKKALHKEKTTVEIKKEGVAPGPLFSMDQTTTFMLSDETLIVDLVEFYDEYEVLDCEKDIHSNGIFFEMPFYEEEANKHNGSFWGLGQSLNTNLYKKIFFVYGKRYFKGKILIDTLRKLHREIMTCCKFHAQSSNVEFFHDFKPLFDIIMHNALYKAVIMNSDSLPISFKSPFTNRTIRFLKSLQGYYKKDNDPESYFNIFYQAKSNYEPKADADDSVSGLTSTTYDDNFSGLTCYYDYCWLNFLEEKSKQMIDFIQVLKNYVSDHPFLNPSFDPLKKNLEMDYYPAILSFLHDIAALCVERSVFARHFDYKKYTSKIKPSLFVSYIKNNIFPFINTVVDNLQKSDYNDDQKDQIIKNLFERDKKKYREEINNIHN